MNDFDNVGNIVVTIVHNPVIDNPTNTSGVEVYHVANHFFIGKSLGVVTIEKLLVNMLFNNFLMLKISGIFEVDFKEFLMIFNVS